MNQSKTITSLCYKLPNLLRPHPSQTLHFINLPNKFQYPITFSTYSFFLHPITSLKFIHPLPANITITVLPTIKDDCLMIRGNVILTRVPENIVVSPVSTASAFLGATSPIPSSRHVFTLGILRGYRLLSLFRVKIWWMIPRVGTSASDVPMETQLLLLEAREESALKDDFSSDTEDPEEVNTSYILFLPVLDGAFRATLQGTALNELQFCVESGDAYVQTCQSLEAVFVNSGDNPFELIRDSIKILEKHNGTFCHLENKEIPVHLDWFGWCTWDAFYTQVNPQGIKEGIQSLSTGGFTPKFIIVDDGWQETLNEFYKEGEPIIEGTQFATRLIDIKENVKFRSAGSNNSCINLHDFVHSIKQNLSVKYVYMWHALAGYWGGVLASSDAMKKYNPKLVYPIQSPSITGNLRDIAMDSLEKYGVGIIDPSKLYDFYNDYHSYLASCGVDGVKVDVQNLIETLGSGYGGRVSLTKLYQEALETSIAKNFKDNNLICCMAHNFVTMSTVEEAESAVEKFNRYDYDGRALTVNVASPRGSRPERVERQPRSFEPALRVYVGNLAWEVDDARLEQIFSEHGKVLNARVIYERETGRSRGFGFVTFSDETEMNDAIAALDGQSLEGRTIRVSVAEDRSRRNSF